MTKICLFYNSVISDWNHGNAHFLRGITSAFLARGYSVKIFEPAGGWSLSNLVRNHGYAPVDEFRKRFPLHDPEFYDPRRFEPETVLQDAGIVIVHEWNDPEIIRKIGKYRAATNHFRLFFHDTHHRSVTRPDEMREFDLGHYDGVLAFGDVLKEIYRKEGWATNIYTWHEAADTTIFTPVRDGFMEGDLVWIGNWGDNERTEELMAYIIEPVKSLNLRAVFYGVRYPPAAIRMLRSAGIQYRGWVPNYLVPGVFSRFRLTVHIPRRPYVQKLPGIPTIRPFEAMASGIPLISSYWEDTGNLFSAGDDYLVAHTAKQMREYIRLLLNDKSVAGHLSANGQRTIKDRHTCFHRSDTFFTILEELSNPGEYQSFKADSLPAKYNPI